MPAVRPADGRYGGVVPWRFECRAGVWRIVSGCCFRPVVVIRPEFDSQTGTYRVDHDGDSPWEASTTLVLAISSVTGEGPTEMLPLSRAVDPDVLDKHVG